MIELILNDGKKSSTYKYALLLGIVDYVIENPLENPMNNFHYIPLIYLAKQFLAYYFPLTLKEIRQGTYSGSNMGIAIATYIDSFFQIAKEKKLFSFSLIIPDNINRLISFIDENDKMPIELIRTLIEIRNTILKLPVKHIRNIGNTKISFFSILTENISIFESYEKHRISGISSKFYDKEKPSNRWMDLLSNEKCYLFFSNQTYLEISKIRFWLRDVLIKRWAQECIRLDVDLNHPDLLSIFDMWKAIPERDYSIIKKYRQLFIENKITKCIYCQKECNNNFEIDHLFPWSKFPVNSFWNLYPACKSCNKKKLDKMPELTNTFLDRIQQHLQICLTLKSKFHELINIDISKLYQNWFHTDPEESKQDNKCKEIKSLIKQLSQNLLETTPGNTINLEVLEKS